MPPDFYFALTLIVKMAVTAVFVVAATVTAERAGPLVGGLVATLPFGAGPVYVFLALDHDAHFIAQSAINSPGHQHRQRDLRAHLRAAGAEALAGGEPFARHAGLDRAGLGRARVHWTLAVAGLANVVVLAVCITLARPLRHVAIPPVRTYWYDLALRGAMVAVLVGVAVSLQLPHRPRRQRHPGGVPHHPDQRHADHAPPRRRQADRGGDGQCGARPGRLCLRLRGAAFCRDRLRLRHRPDAGAGDLHHLGIAGVHRARGAVLRGLAA